MGLTRLLRDEAFDVVAAVDDGEKLVEAVVVELEPDARRRRPLPPSFNDEGVPSGARGAPATDGDCRC